MVPTKGYLTYMKPEGWRFEFTGCGVTTCDICNYWLGKVKEIDAS